MIFISNKFTYNFCDMTFVLFWLKQNYKVSSSHSINNEFALFLLYYIA